MLTALESCSGIAPARCLNDQIFNSQNLDQYQESLLQGLARVRDMLARIQKPSSGILPQELAPAFRAVDLDTPVTQLDEALDEIERLYLKDAVYFHHPRYAAHLNCPVLIPAVVAELVAASVNTAVETWDQSAGGTFIEQSLIDWTAKKIGLGSKADGVFTSGGSQSNLLAMLLARDSHCARQSGHSIKLQGLPDDFSKWRILASEVSHFSIQKAAAILGLGHEAVIKVACDRYYRMDLQHLQQQLAHCQAQGLQPIAVVATAGTTDFGSIDPIAQMAALCRRHELWLHVDAAYGCGLLVSPKYRHWLAGIEQADSVTVDYHKSFFQPVSCSAFLVRDKQHLSHLTFHADYLNPLSEAQAGTPDLVNKSIQTTRRFDALKLWLSLRTLGAEAIGSAFDQVIHLARQTYLLFLSEPCLEVIHQPQMSTLVFRYRPNRALNFGAIDAANAAIRKALARSGNALVASTRVKGQLFLKLTLLNPTTEIQDIQMIQKLVIQYGQAFFEAPETLDAAPEATTQLSASSLRVIREVENA